MTVKAVMQWHTLYGAPTMGQWAVIATVNVSPTYSSGTIRAPFNTSEFFDENTLPSEANEALKQAAINQIENVWGLTFDPATDIVKIVNPFILL